MNLPVPNVESALPFYQTVLGFRVLARGDTPYRHAVLSRDQVQIQLCENGEDPAQDGCAFHVSGLEALFEEFKARGLNKVDPDFSSEQHGGFAWKVFYVIAPDGLCFWFGEQQPS